MKRVRFKTLLLGLTFALATLGPTPNADAKTIKMPGFRTAFGSSWMLDSQTPQAGFNFEALMRVAFIFPGKTRGKGFMVEPVVGYLYQNPENETHLFAGGVDLAYSVSPFFGVSLGTRGVVGSDTYGVAGGIRNSLAFDLIIGVLRAEATHQVLWHKTGSAHTIGFMVGFDPIRTIALIFASKKKSRR